MVTFNKENHIFISEALRSYLKHLEAIRYDDLLYIDELKSLLGKLLRESDWSYILWSKIDKTRAGNLRILKSSLSEIPRNSRWTLFKNGQIKLISFFKTRKLNLFEELVTITPKSNLKFDFFLNNNEFLEIEAETVTLETIKSIAEIVVSVSFKKRMLPALLMLDSVEFYRECNKSNQSLASKLAKISSTLRTEAHGLQPKYIKHTTPKENPRHEEIGRIKLEIGLESLLFLEEALCEYSEFIEKSSSYGKDSIKTAKAKRLLEIFRRAHS